MFELFSALSNLLTQEDNLFYKCPQCGHGLEQTSFETSDEVIIVFFCPHCGYSENY